MEKKLKKILHTFDTKQLPKGSTCFTISSTSKSIEETFFTPIRTIHGLSVCGAVVASTRDAIKIAELVDGVFDYIAVDSEKKICPSRYTYAEDEGNIKGEVQDRIKKSRFFSYKANDITVDALDQFICEKIKESSKVKIAMIGAGNIGFKSALKLVERGYWVKLFRRDQELLNKEVDVINLIKPKGTLAKSIACQSIEEAVRDSDIIIATATTSSIITEEHIALSKNKLLIDCGKNCFTEKVMANNIVYRTDISFDLLYKLLCIKESIEKLYPRQGELKVDNKRYVCGISGTKGNIVVSNIQAPQDTIIGICDGLGGITRDL